MKNVLITTLVATLAGPVYAAGSHGKHAHDAHGHGGAEKPDTHTSQVGRPADTGEATKTFEVAMLDSMRYEFNSPLEIEQGDVVRFIVTNKGNLRHEFSIGNKAEQQAHAEMMRMMPDMKHQDGNTLSLAGGESGEIIWRFEGDPKVVIACNVPGHSEAGMSQMVQTMRAHSSH